MPGWPSVLPCHGEDGVYVVISLSPKIYRIRTGKGMEKLFTKTDNIKELEKILITHLKSKEMDQALTGMADYVFETMKQNYFLATGLQVVDVKPVRPGRQTRRHLDADVHRPAQGRQGRRQGGRTDHDHLERRHLDSRL